MKILTEEMIDAPRRFLSGLEMGIQDFVRMREHMAACGSSIDCWPEWAKTRTGHITKAGKAILIYTMMVNAASEEIKEILSGEPHH